MKRIFDPFPKLRTERLMLRKLRPGDVSEIYALRSDKRISRYIERPLDKSPEESQEFITFINTGIKADKWVYWAICSPAPSRLVGTICLWNFSADYRITNLGYELHPEFQGQGIMSEAIRAVIRFGFKTLEIRRIEAFTHYANAASIKLLERHHFVLDPKRKDKDNKDHVIFLLENNEGRQKIQGKQ